MALQFNMGTTAPLKVRVDLNDAGNIKQTGETPASTKEVVINGFPITNPTEEGFSTFAQAQEVVTSIVGGIFGATYTANSIRQTGIERTAKEV